MDFNRKLSINDNKILKNILNKQLTSVSESRLTSVIAACRYVINNNIQGDFVECGINKGGCSIAASKILSSQKIWCYDTFAGMTEPGKFDKKTQSNIDIHEHWLNKQDKNHNKWCFTSLDDVKHNFKKYGKLDNVQFVVGDVSKVLLSKKLPDKISILRLDTDFYDSTLIELKILYPRLVDGGILLIDDYGSWSGCKKAVDEYFFDILKPIFYRDDNTGIRCIK